MARPNSRPKASTLKTRQGLSRLWPTPIVLPERQARHRIVDQLDTQRRSGRNQASAASQCNLSRAMKIPFSILLFPLLANSYTWQFTSQPRQCQNVTLAIQGSGQPPYSLLIIPVGASPLPNNVETRLVQNIPFSGSSTTLSFELTYPENSSFVAVVSDSSGFGSGGVSTPIPVLPSSDSSCYNASQPKHVPWFFYLDPTGGLVQCESVRLWWEPPSVNGTVSFYGAIPGGTSFSVPQGSLSNNNNTGTGFNWSVDIAAQTSVIVIGSDDRGMGSGGFAQFTVSSSTNSSCLNSNSPSTTAGTPPGGNYPTSTSEPSTSNANHSSSSNTGAIVGGVVGGAVLLLSGALVVSCFLRRRPYSAHSKERLVNVLQDDEDGNGGIHDLPHYYVPEPFVILDLSRGTSGATSTHGGPLSTTMADIQHPQTPMTTASTSTRKSAVPRQSRTVSIVQHDDAGPSEDLSGHGEFQTIELPPAYTNIRQTQRSPLATSTSTSTSTDASGDL